MSNQKKHWLLTRWGDTIVLFGYDADDLQRHGLTEVKEGMLFYSYQDPLEGEREILKILDGELAEKLDALSNFDDYFCNGAILDTISDLLNVLQKING